MIKDSQGKEMIDFWDYMDKKVKITLKDGKIFIGYARKDFGYVLDRDDIKTIEELKED